MDAEKSVFFAGWLFSIWAMWRSILYYRANPNG